MSTKQPHVSIVKADDSAATVTVKSEKVSFYSYITFREKQIQNLLLFLRHSIMTTYLECTWDLGELSMMKIWSIFVRNLRIRKA